MSMALVIIDVQNAILHGKGTAARQAAIDAALDEAVARLAALHRLARSKDVPAIPVQHDGDPSHRLACGSEGWQIRAELAPAAGDVVVHKTSCDSFFETDLQDRLAERGVNSLVVGGCMTQFCVDTMCRRAVSLGYDVTLIADGHMTADMGDLTFSQIIAHHNAVLDGFDAGRATIKVTAARDVRF
ncbi:cysteine hydrolase family protein [Dongia deserti]|uniref:cysteine hydrolase family protein n=1 Tax=Dongia deserti TaxID=2268030 RepID=UPI000E64B646|nr:cysteine hydrolase family protein [Dongia deserti]